MHLDFMCVYIIMYTHCYVIMVICIAPLTGGYSEALSAWQAGEKKSLHTT